MSFRSVVAEALSALRFYGARSAVTMLSLAWGVASFVLLMSYGQGFDRAVRSGIDSVGENLLVVWSGGRTSLQRGGMRAGRRIRLTVHDAEVIQKTAPLVEAISPELYRGIMTVVRDNRDFEYAVRGVWSEYGGIRNMTVAEGRWISHDDDHVQKRVAVLGATVAWELFRGVPPIGEEIRIGRLPFTVVGVLAVKGELRGFYSSDNLSIYLPYNTMSYFGDTRYPVHMVWVSSDPDRRQDSIQQVRAVLAGIHRFSPRDERAATAMAFDAYLKWIEDWSDGLGLVLWVIGVVTLAIGGVGLANIMLASVKERTREIGTLMALGAARRSVLAQFLAEAIALVSIGGVAGILLAWMAVSAFGSMPVLGPLMWSVGSDTAEAMGNVALTIDLPSIGVCLGVLLMVGLVSGMIPAIKASRLDPVEALRYE